MTGPELKIELVEHSALIFSSSAHLWAPTFLTRSKISSFKVYFSAAC
jgi:hypothetical protein